MPRVRVEQRSELAEEGGSASEIQAAELDIMEQADALLILDAERQTDGDADLQPGAEQRSEPALRRAPSPPAPPLSHAPRTRGKVRSITLHGDFRTTSSLDAVSTPAFLSLSLPVVYFAGMRTKGRLARSRLLSRRMMQRAPSKSPVSR